MKLESMIVSNFRQFYGDQTIRFSTDPVRNVTVICGVNGAGKTTLLTALVWCLYGRKFESLGELVNKRALVETSIGASVEVKVQLSFTHEAERYSALRIFRADRVSQDAWNRDREPALSLTVIRSDGQFETVQNPTGRIESIIPSAVSPYFFFDGEKIDQFARPGHEEDVRNAVKKVLKIEVLERAKEHLAAVVREYRQELGRQIPGALSTLIERQTRLREEQDKLMEKLDMRRRERLAAEAQSKDIDQRLSEINAAREWIVKRERATAELRAKENDRDNLWVSVREAANRGFIPLSHSAIDTALKILDEKRQRGEIPPGIREQFVQDLISRKRCICGRPVNDHSEEHDELSRLLGRSVSSEVENEVIQSAGDLRSLNASHVEIPSALRRLMKTKVAIEDAIEQLNQELDEISRHLEGFDEQQISGLERRRRELQTEIVRLAGEIGGIEVNTNLIRGQIEGIDAEIAKAQIQQEKARRIQRRFGIASKAAAAVDKMCDVFASDMRKQIREQAKRIFDRLIWKDSQFQDVQISDDYYLEVIDRWGLPARRELSAGERQVLSLAFITGMSKVADEEAPLVMDTPFGRLSSQHREKIAATVPEITKQLVLLVTDEELHSRARKNIEPRIGAEYELAFDQTTGCTSVRTVK